MLSFKKLNNYKMIHPWLTSLTKINQTGSISTNLMIIKLFGINIIYMNKKLKGKLLIHMIGPTMIKIVIKENKLPHNMVK